MGKAITIGIIQYGAGNLASIINVLERIGVNSVAIKTPKDMEKVDKLIIPGVGHAMKAMQELKNSTLDKKIKETNLPLLGICLGMQLLGTGSHEGKVNCLSICDFETVRFDVALKVPQIGWNKVRLHQNKLFYGLNREEWFYFVHSFYIHESKHEIAKSNYGVDFIAAVQHKNFWGVQFHPEKSGEKGIQILKNFIELC